MYGGASQCFLDDVAPFCNLIGRGEILPCGTKIEYAFHQTLFPRAIKRLGKRLKSSWVVACVSTLKVVGSGSVLPQERFEVYSLRDCFW